MHMFFIDHPQILGRLTAVFSCHFNADDKLFYPKNGWQILLLINAANEGGQSSRKKLHKNIKYEEKASLKPLAIDVRASVCMQEKDCKSVGIV